MGFSIYKFAKVWSVLLEHFIKHNPLFFCRVCSLINKNHTGLGLLHELSYLVIYYKIFSISSLWNLEPFKSYIWYNDWTKNLVNLLTVVSSRKCFGLQLWSTQRVSDDSTQFGVKGYGLWPKFHTHDQATGLVQNANFIPILPRINQTIFKRGIRLGFDGAHIYSYYWC